MFVTVGKGGAMTTLKNDKVHSFREKLEYSVVSSDEDFWDKIYKKAFPYMTGSMLNTGDTTSQHMGVDRIIHLSNGRILRIDEKKRSVAYPDILLEFVSNNLYGTLGWVEKPLIIDYLAYAFMPIQTVYLFDWLMLQNSWNENKEKWKKRYPIISANNSGYKTLSVAIPIETLQNSIKEISVIKL